MTTVDNTAATKTLAIRLESDAFDCSHVQIHTLTGREAISQLFSFELGIVCLDPGGLTLNDVLGAEATLLFIDEQSGSELRRVHGMVSQARRAHEPEAAFAGYRLWLVPRLFRLSMSEMQEIFLDHSIVTIFMDKLQRAGLRDDQDVKLRLGEDYPPREHVTQYKESDLAFVSRLAEHHGIHYHFEHHDGADQLIFGDHNEGFPHIGPANLRSRGDKREVYQFEETVKLIPRSYAVTDYNYRTPQLALDAVVEAESGAGGVIVEYGTHHKTPEEAERFARIRADTQQAGQVLYDGSSDLCRFTAGARFELEGPHALDDPQLLLVEVEHHAEQPTGLHGGSEVQRRYHNRFKAVPARHTYRPPRITPRPRIDGLLTGFVEHGIQHGTEHWAKLDSEGRYTIRFRFDVADHEQKQSRWCRMLQPHAGEHYGMHWPLKPGIEVAVAFIDGDPDRPLIVGAVPNPLTPSPVTAANHRINELKTVSGAYIEIHDAPEPGE